MTQEEFQWHLNDLKGRYEYLAPDDDQAKKIYSYELERDQPGGKAYLTDWEELECEWTVFKEILNSDQFRIFEKELDRRREYIIQSLRDSDARAIKRMEQQLEKNDFLKNIFVPDLLKARKKEGVLIYADQSKINYLKAQYLAIINDYRKSDYSNHFRHSRTFQPTEFKCRQLLIESNLLWPACHFFETEADEPTLIMFRQMKASFNYFSESRPDLLESKIGELAAFDKALSEKYYKPEDLEGGLLIGGLQAPDRKREPESFVMSMALADPAFYLDILSNSF